MSTLSRQREIQRRITETRRPVARPDTTSIRAEIPLCIAVSNASGGSVTVELCDSEGNGDGVEFTLAALP